MVLSLTRSQAVRFIQAPTRLGDLAALPARGQAVCVLNDFMSQPVAVCRNGACSLLCLPCVCEGAWLQDTSLDCLTVVVFFSVVSPVFFLT